MYSPRENNHATDEDDGHRLMEQLTRSNSAAATTPTVTAASAINERTLEECWSTLQRIFMHKSAMQMQAQDVHNRGVGGGGGGGTITAGLGLQPANLTNGRPNCGNGNDIKPHQCQQCLKSFSSNHQLVQHIRVHTGEKPYKCSYCDRRFKQLSHVQQHTRLHTGERPYKCHLPECGRAFIQLSNLQQHLRNHDAQVERAKNRPFHCNICGKGFATESSLRTHTSKELQLHLGVLQQHAAFISGPTASTCPICHKLFLNVETLLEHMKFVHKDIAPNMNNNNNNSTGSSANIGGMGPASSQNLTNDNQSSNQSTINLSASTKMHSPTPTTTPRPQEANDQNNLSMLPYNHHQLTGGQPATQAVAAAAATLLSQSSSQVNSVMNNNFYHSFHAANAQTQLSQCHSSPTSLGGGGNGGVSSAGNSGSLPMDQSPVQSQQSYQDPGHLAVIFAAAAAAKRASSAQHICRICGKNYINEGSLRKHMNTHPKTTQMGSNLRMWPCTVCQAVFTQESGLINHMEHMRMDPKHQFFSRAVSVNRQTGGGVGGAGAGLLEAAAAASPVLRLQIPGASSDQLGGGAGSGSQTPGDENNNLMLHQQQLLSNMDAYNHFREQMQCGQSAMGGGGNGGGGVGVNVGNTNSLLGALSTGSGNGGNMNDSESKHCVDENNLMAHQLNINLHNAAAGLNSTLSQAFQQQLGGSLGGGGNGGGGNLGMGEKDDRGLLMKDDTSDSVHAAVVVNLAAAMRIQQHQLNCSGIL